MEEYTETQLTETAVKMLTQGSGYRSIRAFLKKNCDEATEDSIVNTLIQYERENKAEIEKAKEMLRRDLEGGRDFSTIFYKVFSGVMFGLGAILSVVLWDAGWVSTIPFGMMGYGGYGLSQSRRR